MSDEEAAEPTASSPPGDGRPVFPHPPWTVGVVLVFGCVFLLLGLLGNPLWLLGGSPFIVVLLLWIGVRLVQWRRTRNDAY